MQKRCLKLNQIGGEHGDQNVADSLSERESLNTITLRPQVPPETGETSC